jgi:hypothetical protein
MTFNLELSKTASTTGTSILFSSLHHATRLLSLAIDLCGKRKSVTSL